jgi:hypothetical protein
VPVTAFYGAASARASDRGFAYLRSAGSLRLVRAYAVIPARTSRAALVALAEALARGGRFRSPDFAARNSGLPEVGTPE